MIQLYTATAGVLAIPEDLAKLALEDLWASIARIYRYGGQVNWTVLQHSHLVAELCPPELYAMALYHDLSEGLLGDLQAPLRGHINMFSTSPQYEILHHEINAEIGRRMAWPVDWEFMPEIVAADKRAFQLEVITMIPPRHLKGFGLHLANINRPSAWELAAIARASHARIR